MELGSLPVWAQQLGGLLLTLATAVVLTWSERRKTKAAGVPVDGAAEVVAASFVDRRLLQQLIDAIGGLNGNVAVLIEHVETINERMHEDEIVRAAVARIREERP